MLVNTALTTFLMSSQMHVLCYGYSFACEFFHLFFSVCCFSLPLFFFIEEELGNDGIGEIMVNVTTVSFHSYLNIFFVSGLKYVIRSHCPYLVMGSFSQEEERNTALFPRDIM